MMNAMNFILFPSYFSAPMSQNIFHGGAIELGQVLVELFVWEEHLSKSIDCCLLVIEWNGDLFPVEASDVVSE